MATATFHIWRGDKSGGEFKEYQAEIGEEDALLMSIPGYRERMGDKPSFVPRLSGR